MERFPAKVLVATDGSKDALLATRAAIDLCTMTGAELHLVHVWRTVPSPHFEPYIRKQLEREARELLDEQVKTGEALGGVVAGSHLREGQKSGEILDLAEELGDALLVIGTRGHGPVRRLLLGSVSEGVVYHASSPVLVMRGGEEAWPPARIIIGDDGSEDARGAAQLAARIGGCFGSPALLVRAYPRLPEMDDEGRRLDARMVDDELRREERYLAERATEIEGLLDSRSKIHIAVGNPASCILQAAQESRGGAKRALVAVGSRGFGPLGRMTLGSVSTKVLKAAEGPVLIYPHPRD
ncbi:MAG TPA: universal stress protein [Rubrobacter sp.]|nr:universal stress protein [Rubrobacter sp.]